MGDGDLEVKEGQMITISRISKQFGKKAILQDISLEIKKGEVFGLLGPNGAGKSTLLSILATISQPSTGSVTVKQLDLVKQKKQARQLIGYVPQDISLWEDMTVKENLFFWSKFTKGKVSNKKLFEICQTVHLEEKWTEKVSKLSGGMKRKLNIAVALIHDPDVLLMDEPTVGIDLQSKLEINQYIKKLSEQGKTIVYTTHDMSEILFLCDRIGVLKQGKIHFIGTINDAKDMMKEQTPLQTDEQVMYRLLNE